MKTRSAKNKGKRFQNQIAELISEAIKLPFGKDKDIQSRTMGISGEDIPLSNRAKELFPYAVECKNCEKWSIPKWIDDARRYKTDNRDWLLFCSKNRFKPIVIMDALTFFKLIRMNINQKKLIKKLRTIIFKRLGD